MYYSRPVWSKVQLADNKRIHRKPFGSLGEILDTEVIPFKSSSIAHACYFVVDAEHVYYLSTVCLLKQN